MCIFIQSCIYELSRWCQVEWYFNKMDHTHAVMLRCLINQPSLKIHFTIYHVRGLFGGDFNLAVWRIFIGSPNLNYAVLTFENI